MKSLCRIILVAGLVALAASCGDSQTAAVPAPRELTRDAVGYFCGMTVLDHKGPKGQVILGDREQPLWFTSVRDAIAFTRLPGEPKNIIAIYVTDVGRASWDTPEPGTWIDARKAFYVVGSRRVGGMQAPELAPFSRREDAERFMKQYGGKIYTFDAIPRDSIPEAAG